MKKILTVSLAIVMLVCINLTAFAAPNGFVSSPTGNGAPTVVEFKPANDQCTAKLVITPYGDRGNLPQVLQELMQKAYDAIVNAKDLTELNADFAKLVKEKGVDPKNLAVSDLFDIQVPDCDFHDGHTEFDVVLTAETLKHFVGMLHMNKNGQFEFVSDAKVVGDHLHFSVESFSPFAIVVDTSVEDTPTTGDDATVYICTATLIVSALGIVVIGIKSKKQSA